MSKLEAPAVAGVIVQVVTVVVVVVAGKADEAIAEVVIPVVIPAVISVAISGVEATAHVGAMKVVHTTVSEERFSASSRVIASYATADKSAGDMSSSESTATTNVASSESAAASKTAAATHVSTAKSAATTKTAATAAMPGGERARRHRGTERDGGKENHRLARDRLLLAVLKEVHNISLSSIRLNVHLLQLFTKAQIKIVFLLHSLLNGIQEWTTALRTSRSFLRDLS
jgi:hypothetical protein